VVEDLQCVPPSDLGRCGVVGGVVGVAEAD
jgi:hypothetical protein